MRAILQSPASRIREPADTQLTQGFSFTNVCSSILRDVNLTISRSGFRVTAEKWEQGERPAVEELSEPGKDQTLDHVRNFLDCVKSRKRPNADVEEGHLTAVMCHLGNIATLLERSLRWDSEREQVIGDTEANQWLSRPYREPWKLPDEI